jgi:hypothetical protein
MKLTEHAARLALLKMAEDSSDDIVTSCADFLRKESSAPKEGKQITFGPWHCNIEDMSFVLTFESGPIFAQYSGHFEVQNQSWIAVIDSSERN